MKAIQITEFGGPDVMHLVELDTPTPTEGQELINVSAIGINYADTHQTENSYLSPQKLPLVPGIEVVGTTASGLRVLAPVDGGGYAQQAVTHSATMIPIPDGVTDEQALCMLVQGSTAWHILKTVGHVKPGESVVIHAAAGGVGTIAIQLAKMWGAKVIAVTSSKDKSELATKLGIAVGEKAPIDATRKAVLELRGAKGMLLNPSDRDSWSAGSFFTNPIVTKEIAATLPEGAPKWPTSDGMVKTSAAWLIEHAGVHKGDSHGGARVSTKHVLALTNAGNATATDIAELAKSAQQSVFEKFGITLETEVNLVGLSL